MRVFVAGATGALGVPVVRLLVADGHEVVGLTRSPSRASIVTKLFDGYSKTRSAAGLRSQGYQ